jgi:hypothetical protein
MRWTGPFRLREYLDRLGADRHTNAQLPPEQPGVYVVTEQTWRNEPTSAAGPVYVGESSLLRGRIGDLISSACGFHGTLAGRHSGGITISNLGYNLFELYLAWLPMSGASAESRTLEEDELIAALRPKCNKRGSV